MRLRREWVSKPPCAPSHAATPAMIDDSQLSFSLPSYEAATGHRIPPPEFGPVAVRRAFVCSLRPLSANRRSAARPSSEVRRSNITGPMRWARLGWVSATSLSSPTAAPNAASAASKRLCARSITLTGPCQITIFSTNQAFGLSRICCRRTSRSRRATITLWNAGIHPVGHDFKKAPIDLTV